MKKVLVIGVLVACSLFLIGKYLFQNKNFYFVKRRVQDIRNKIETETHDRGLEHWAGTYYYGDGLGLNMRLDIAPDAGFVFEWSGCLGIYDINYGKVIIIDKNRLKLSFALSNKEDVGFSSEFIIIKLGERFYLINPDKIAKFHKAVDEGIEPRDKINGLFFLRIETQNRNYRIQETQETSK
jgi:hypothetical protein